MPGDISWAESMNNPEKSNHRIVIAVVALCVIARIAVHCATGYQVDDALITFRYAENLAAGNGFVYNIGEQVCGTTTPLFTVLLGLLGAIGIPTSLAALCISIVCAAVTAFVLIRLAHACGAGQASSLPAIIYSVYPRNLISDICGLETALFTMLLVVGLMKAFQKEHWQAGTIAGLAALTRPEGLGLLTVVAITAIVDRAPRLWRVLLPPLFLIGGWVVFAASYFGMVLPNSVAAKSALYHDVDSGLLGRLGEMMTLGTTPGVMAFLMLIAVTFWLAFKRDRSVLVALTALGLVSGLAFFSPRIFFWYAAPALPLIFVLVGRFFGILCAKYRLSSAAIICSIAIIIILGVVSFGRIADLKREMAWYEANHIAAAEYLNAHSQTDDIVLAEDIGHFGYHYRGKIIDRDGLVTPQAIDYNLRGEYLQFVDSVKADWIFIARDYPTSQEILTSASFRDRYAEENYGNSTEMKSHLLFRQRR